MTAVTVLVGSVYGGALMTARELGKQFRAQGHCIKVVEEPGLKDLEAGQEPVLICTSTTGQGEVPPGLLPLYAGLRDHMPMQEGRPFGIIVLGDSSYGDTFCGAGDLMEEALLEVAAVKVGETLRIDALEVTEPETVAIPWFEDWLSQLP